MVIIKTFTLFGSTFTTLGAVHPTLFPCESSQQRIKLYPELCVDKAALALYPAPPSGTTFEARSVYDVGIPRAVIDAVLCGPLCLQRQWAWLTNRPPLPLTGQPRAVLQPRYQPVVRDGVIVHATFGAEYIDTDAKDIICASCGALCEPEWFKEACGRFSV